MASGWEHSIKYKFLDLNSFFFFQQLFVCVHVYSYFFYFYFLVYNTIQNGSNYFSITFLKFKSYAYFKCKVILIL